MNAHLKSILRRRTATVLLLVLLIASTCIASIGVSALNSAKKQLRIISNQYTTIAVPSGQYQEKIFDNGSYTSIGIDSMRLLGVSATKTWRECFLSLLLQIAVAVLLGNALASMLYGWITQMLLSTSLSLSYGSVLLCGALQFLLLFVVGLIWTHCVANRNLMQKR